MVAITPVIAARVLFSVLGLFMLATLLYTIFTDGSPFRKEVLTPWMGATLIDFYINVAAIWAWVIYKESNCFGALLWIVLLICFGSISTCLYIVIELFKLSPEDPLYLVFLNSRSRFSSVPGRECESC
ncbi:uncharacterized protein LOC116267580 isoform X2 [Nymphaea colorata]|uniref:uncharacterized protein LOC116267580 isoform X2 n=1 Tax=Nymphaea colorata TaxID=210225 RepID=UPI00162C8A89|nr:uncharacterized protein LOC116267580 isoform X2 [Nymphaea colorata]